MLTKLVCWLKEYNAAINSHCREIAIQRDKELAEYQIWKGIVR